MVIPVSIGVGAVVGAMILMLGLRGRCIDDHPVCGHCRFDLIGVYPAATVPARCPECGTDLAKPRAVRVGQRRHRRFVAALGGVLLLVSLTAGLALGWSAVQGPGLNKYKPSWWLETEARVGDVSVAGAALSELNARLMDDKLSASGVRRLALYGLTRQADRDHEWVAGWGDVIEGAHAKNILASDEWQRYLREAGVVSFSVRPQITEGDPCAVEVAVRASRVGNSRGLWLVPVAESARVDGREPQALNKGGGGYMGLHPDGSGTMTFSLPIQADPGRHELVISWRLEIHKDFMQTPGEAQWTMQSTVPVEILPSGTPTVRLVPDESLRAAMTASMSAERLSASPSGGQVSIGGQIHFKGLPTSAAFEVIWRERADDGSPGREWPICTVTGRRSSANSDAIMGLSGQLSGFTANRVDVILRPSIAAAARTIDLREIWDGEVVIPDAPVKWPKSMNAPK
jgi:hypothetical protein